ncbi:DHA2 family efflux MFS transporter permease subunit [Pseudonocardia spinosispora]|uniref:DHA2 family efflux MFS transporter permease subunit n=1 Tax=Pseudonocardia spinosispora TaxID=103441 RepID=UPI0004065059|nr:DHA2 family efflux MFS transporter permease subunit [Pseudonocardia spinosispora]
MTGVLVLTVGTLLPLLDLGVLNVALPVIQQQFGVSVDAAGWVVTASLLALAFVVPAAPWLSDRFGLVRLYVAALVGFAVCSVLCAAAWDLGSLIAFRVLQAVPAGLLPVVTLSILYKIVPASRIGAAMGIFGLGLVVAPAAGPTVGGFLLLHAEWRWAFYLCVGLSVVTAIAARLGLPTLPRAHARSFDWWGYTTISYGLFAVLLAASNGQDWGWASYPTLALFATGLLSLAFFAVIENEVRAPLLDLRTLTRFPYIAAVSTVAAVSLGLFASTLYLPPFVQLGHGLSALDTGVMLLPQAVAMAVVVPLSGIVADRFGPRWPAIVGLVVAAYGTYLLSGLSIDMTKADVIAWTVVRGIGVGLAVMPVVTAGLNSLPYQFIGFGSALLAIVQRVSCALCLAVLVSGRHVAPPTAPALAPDMAQDELRRLTEQETGLAGLWWRLLLHVTASTYGDVFLVAAVLTSVAVLLVVRLKKSRPASMRVIARIPKTVFVPERVDQESNSPSSRARLN